MKNYSYHKKYHYLLKYFIMSFPLILILICFISKSFGTYNNVSHSVASYFNVFSTEFTTIFTTDLYLPNAWYGNLITILSPSGETEQLSFQISGILLSYPCYILWVYIMDLILDIFAMVPKLAHKLLYKLGGGIDD